MSYKSSQLRSSLPAPVPLLRAGTTGTSILRTVHALAWIIPARPSSIDHQASSRSSLHLHFLSSYTLPPLTRFAFIHSPYGKSSGRSWAAVPPDHPPLTLDFVSAPHPKVKLEHQHHFDVGVAVLLFITYRHASRVVTGLCFADCSLKRFTSIFDLSRRRGRAPVADEGS